MAKVARNYEMTFFQILTFGGINFEDQKCLNDSPRASPLRAKPNERYLPRNVFLRTLLYTKALISQVKLLAEDVARMIETRCIVIVMHCAGK